MTLEELIPTEEIEDITEYYAKTHERWKPDGSKSKVLKAERRGPNVLVLFYTGDDWVQSIDGTRTKHELTYHWLTSSNAELCEVQGQETIITAKPDLKKPLFHQFRLWC